MLWQTLFVWTCCFSAGRESFSALLFFLSRKVRRLRFTQNTSYVCIGLCSVLEAAVSSFYFFFFFFFFVIDSSLNDDWVFVRDGEKLYVWIGTSRREKIRFKVALTWWHMMLMTHLDCSKSAMIAATLCCCYFYTCLCLTVSGQPYSF